MPAREKMQPQPPRGAPLFKQITPRVWHFGRQHHGSPFFALVARIAPAHMPAAQPVCDTDGWWWFADEGFMMWRLFKFLFCWCDDRRDYEKCAYCRTYEKDGTE